MNSIPSMDRHIQQTNDRLQCIKQVRCAAAAICHKYSRPDNKAQPLHRSTWVRCVSMFPL